MGGVHVLGVGSTRCGERWDQSLLDLAREAVDAARTDAGVRDCDAVIVGNMLSGELNAQSNLGPAIADACGLVGCEAFRVEGACASGGHALRLGWLMIRSGQCKTVLVVGAEKMTDTLPDEVTAKLALAADADAEQLHGATFTAFSALVTQTYLSRYGYRPEDLSVFSINAHANAVANPLAMFRTPLTAEACRSSPIVATPLHVTDCSPICDGAAAMILSTQSGSDQRPDVRLTASSAATSTMRLAERPDMLWLDAAARSAQSVYATAGLGPDDIGLFELHDAFPVVAALSLEACGFAAKGEGARFAMEGGIRRGGRLPIQTFGGLKARGHPVGATGVYQAVEACRQLREEAGDAQIHGVRNALVQSIGGFGTSVVTHLLQRP